MIFKNFYLILLACFISLTKGLCPDSNNATCDLTQFPADFKFGAGSSAYQIEGGWNEDGKSRSFWDYVFNDRFAGYPNANIGGNSYHYYEDDVEAIQKIGLNYYRFSLSWSRILPKGYKYEINAAGVNYYNNLINKLLDAGIEPFVTIFHWDTPLALMDIGGWTNSEIVQLFVDYADVVFELFGDRVKLWGTINEPLSFCEDAVKYLKGLFPEIPFGRYEYLCGHNVLLAHAQSYRLYDEKYKSLQNGQIGIVLNHDDQLPLTNSTEDQNAVERAIIFKLGWFANPIVYGDYPSLMKEVIAENSAKQNFSSSRLPSFTASEKVLLKKSFDIFFINHYSVDFISSTVYNNTPSFDNDMQVISTTSSTLQQTNIGFTIYPPAIRNVLGVIKNLYGNLKILIAENGFSNSGGLNDTDRITYIQEYLEQIRLAMCEDNIRVIGYTYWSLLDSFEWSSSYAAKFGLVEVNFTTFTRSLKESAYFYKNLIETRVINSTSD